MANSGQVVVRDDYFHCSICLEIYETPRTLPCLHTFCEECLKVYIFKIKEKTGIQQLFCPVCRADTKTDNVKFSQVERWVEYFPINFTLLSILKERILTMNPKGNDCEACLREYIKVDAIVYCYDCSEKLCGDCTKHHRKSKASSNHKLIDTSDKLDNNSDLAIVEYLANLTKCPRHGTEGVKYLCKDHDQLCCNECAIVTHRKCEDIVSLADEINTKTEKNTEVNITTRLNTVEIYIDKLIKHETTYLTNIDKKENEVKGCLNDLKAKLDAAYHKLEQRIMLEISDRKQALSKASSLQKETVEKLKEDVKEAGHKIKTARTFGTSLHVFLLEREMGKLVTQYEDTITTLSDKSSKAAITLSEASSLEETVRKIGDLYQIDQINEEQHLPTILQSKDFKNRKLSLEREVNLHETQPRYCLWIGNYIVVSFEYSSKLAAYKADDGSLLSSHQCLSPTSVTATENEEFAVALSTSNKINIMKIRQNQMVCLRRILCKTPDLIAYNGKDKHLLIFSRCEMMLRKISLIGSDAGCINLRNMEKSYLQNTYNLSVDSQYGHVFMSSHNQHKLFCIDMSGNLLFHHSTDHPWSVIIDAQGNIYVASYTGKCIQQLSQNGQLITANIVGDVKVVTPMALSFNKEMSKMVLTCDEGSGKMKIYKF